MLFNVFSIFDETKTIIRKYIHEVTYQFVRLATFPLIVFLLIIYYLCSAMNQLYYSKIILCHDYEFFYFVRNKIQF